MAYSLTFSVTQRLQRLKTKKYKYDIAKRATTGEYHSSKYLEPQNQLVVQSNQHYSLLEEFHPLSKQPHASSYSAITKRYSQIQYDNGNFDHFLASNMQPPNAFSFMVGWFRISAIEFHFCTAKFKFRILHKIIAVVTMNNFSMQSKCATHVKKAAGFL